MKESKLLIPVRCTTRKFYLHKPPPGRNDWHVRFTPPPIDGVRRVVFRNTGTKEIGAAKRIAADIIKSFWIDAGRGAERLKLRNDNATIGEVIAKYEQRAAQRPGTIRSNVRSLRMLIKTVYGGDPDLKSTSVLTANLIREFEKRQLERAEKRATPATRSIMIQKVRVSTASYVRQARSIVALRKMKFYEGLKLPDLSAFRGESIEAPKRSLPRPLDMKLLTAMEAAAPTLAKRDPGGYVAHLLFSRVGLRNIEIVNARVHWISEGRIGIVNRPEEDFFPKGCEGWVPIAPDVLREILRFQSLCTDGYLVPGANRTERHDAVYRRHSTWVSQWIKDRTKTSYELRRYAGSRLLDMGATIFEVRDFLRHRDVQTTQTWYAYRLQNRQLRRVDTMAQANGRVKKIIEAAERQQGEVKAALVEKGYEELRGLCELIVEQEMLKGVTQRYAPNVMMTKLDKINIAELGDSITAMMPIFEKACRYIASHSQPIETQGIRPTLDELKNDYDTVLKAREPHKM